MSVTETNFSDYTIVAVVPAFNVEGQIEGVIHSMPDFIKHIVVVDDASSDQTGHIIDALAESSERVIALHNNQNQGVGGAMIAGFQVALSLDAQVVVKLDGDGQMDPDHIPDLVTPLLQGKADYTKGNRFRDFESLRQMPVIRRVGNLSLSFLAKAATGYWTCFDPTNGFVAIRGEILRLLPFDRLAKTYYFETSMLSQLYLLGAFVYDVYMPAQYHGQPTHLSITKILVEFPFKLLGTFLRRLVLKNFLFDFNMESIFLLTGVPMLLFGLIFGGYNWIYFARSGIGAPTGTIMIAVLSIILSIQFLLSAIQIDLRAMPMEPLSKPLA